MYEKSMNTTSTLCVASSTFRGYYNSWYTIYNKCTMYYSCRVKLVYNGILRDFALFVCQINRKHTPNMNNKNHKPIIHVTLTHVH